MWRQVVAQSPDENAPQSEVLRYDIGWKALNTMLRSGRSLSGKERNCCFLNTQGQRFANISAAADIDFDDDGRVVAVCDWTTMAIWTFGLRTAQALNFGSCVTMLLTIITSSRFGSRVFAAIEMPLGRG